MGRELLLSLIHIYLTNTVEQYDVIATVAGGGPVSYTHLDVYKRQC